MLSIKKIKNPLFLVIFITLFFLFSRPVSALEVTYPSINGVGINSSSNLSDYIRYFFYLFTTIGAVLALISFTIGAVGLISPNPESHADAKDRMKGAVLGLVLILVSFVIMNTINPVLVTPVLTKLTPLPTPTVVIPTGVSFYQSNDCSGINLGLYATTSLPDTQRMFSHFEIHSVKITEDFKNNIYYGFILHQVAGLGLGHGGKCTVPITTSGCNTLPFSTDHPELNVNPISAVDIFQMSVTSGMYNGINFYSKPNGRDIGVKDAGDFYISDPDIQNISLFDNQNPKPLKTDDMLYDYTGSTATPEDQRSYSTFTSSPGSIFMNGGLYLVGIYSNTTESGGVAVSGYCQTYNEIDVVNLRAEPLTKPGKRVSLVYMIKEAN